MSSLRSASLVLAPLLATSFALADVSPGDRAAAEALFDSARKLTSQEKYAEACPKFEESNRLDPAVGTRLYLADCYERVGRFASAWITFREAAAAAHSANQLDREKKALQLAAGIEPKLSRIALQIPRDSDLPGLVIKRDGTVLGRPLWDLPTPVDPGSHTLEASAPGRKTWTLAVEIKDPGQTRTITIPVLPAEAAPATSHPAASATAPASAAPPLPPPSASVVAPPPGNESVFAGRTPALIAGGVGVVGLVAGTIFAIRASSKWSSAKDGCPGNHCTSRDSYDDARSAHSSGNVATALLGVGLVGIGAGAVLWFTASPSSSASTGRYLAPTFVAGGGGLTAGGSW